MHAQDDTAGTRTKTIAFGDLIAMLKAALISNGYSESSADILARNCGTAQRDGSVSHGVFRLKDYAATIRSGYVNGDSRPSLTDVAPSFIRADADNGFAQVAIALAADDLRRKAKENGIALLAVRNSHHLGALYLDVEDFARDGFIALAVVNSIAVVAPPGGTRGVYGTNPLAFAAPRADGDPLVFDQASSVMAHGDVQVAHREGRLLPEGAGIDKLGHPTNVPGEILDGGAISTFGGHKGASIALMVELLCAGLVGADFSFEVDWSKTPGARTARTGETIILINPGLGLSDDRDFRSRASVLLEALLDAGQKHVPGERRARSRRELGENVVVSDDDLAMIESFTVR